MSAFFEDGLYQWRATTGRPRMPCIVTNDCRSLYDVIQKVQPDCEEKRTFIDILSVKEHVGQDGLYWIPTHEQLAGPLTKIDRVLPERCTNFMMDTSPALRCDAP